jgi:hypothetical protein
MRITRAFTEVVQLLALLGTVHTWFGDAPHLAGFTPCLLLASGQQQAQWADARRPAQVSTHHSAGRWLEIANCLPAELGRPAAMYAAKHRPNSGARAVSDPCHMPCFISAVTTRHPACSIQKLRSCWKLHQMVRQVTSGTDEWSGYSMIRCCCHHQQC